MKSLADNVYVLGSIPVNLQADEVLKRIRMRSENKRIEEIVREVVEIVAPVVQPKVIYTSARINARNGDTIEIGGVEFMCHALRAFDTAQPVFPYVATCGLEIETLKLASGDAMKSYCLTIIKNMVATSAVSYLQDYLVKDLGLEQRISSISPGHPESWPIKQRRELFSLLGVICGM